MGETLTQCEGRCGALLDAEMREYAPIPDGFKRPDDDYTPTHTPARCRLIRTFRDAVEHQLPDHRVEVVPHRPKALFVMAWRMDDDAQQKRDCWQMVREDAVMLRSWDLIEHYAETTARALARTLRRA